MAIVKLDKLTVYGTRAQKDVVLDGLQQLGCLHLIPLGDPPNRHPQSELVSREARQALRYLLAAPIQRRPTTATSQYDRGRLIEDVLLIKHRRDQLRVERDHLSKAIEGLEPWGDFQLPTDEQLGDQSFWFYVIPLRQVSQLPSDVPWTIANKDNRFAYVVAFGESASILPFPTVELDRRPLSRLRQRLERVADELEELHWRRVAHTRWLPALRQDLDVADDRTAQVAAAKGTLDTDTVFAVQGWVPHVAADDVRAFGEQHQLAVTFERPRPEDKPPTLLKNPERVAGAEGCVTFYITPGYHAWDPTTVVFFSFSLFFAMIIADAGYGLVMATGLCIFWRKLSATRLGRRMRNLLLGIISVTIIYGVMLGSYFGLEPPVASLLDSLRVRIGGQPMMENQNAMMVISVAIGVAHLTMANVISAWQKRRSLRCLGHVGWAQLMLGGFLFGAGKTLEVNSLENVGLFLSVAGAGAVLLFSSERPLATTNLKTHLLRLLDGIMQTANLSKAFGDILSYLRLFALGLASAQLAITFNELASSAFRSGSAGILLALIILVVGHSINFLLGLMGGVVHGLRLNCIEFFNWSLSDEGYAFQPFTKKAKT